ncbi:hypothetical protein BTO30_02720 [Domibacillus antri]|uniref:HTH cro/C1-type domain-containing protein n=1 Tax=Domibacillus antri TaxID=1714264 RepID=A0A1Q8Q987_9BACI|nr:helix-turn-helix domain-containing protein [Domibacillus antri]OLN23871.1 hypothetical protein BTO30_02720 [Domibacillus antri]
MKIFADRLKKLRESRKETNPHFTQGYVAEILGVARTTYTAYENGTKQPPMETVIKIANLFDTSTDYLLGRNDSKNSNSLPELTEKDEQNIMTDLEAMINNLESKNGMASFDGHTVDELDDEDRELLIASLEQSMRLAKRIAKQKYTPKKYRKEQE